MPGVMYILNLSHHLRFQCIFMFHKEMYMFSFPTHFCPSFPSYHVNLDKWNFVIKSRLVMCTHRGGYYSHVPWFLPLTASSQAGSKMDSYHCRKHQRQSSQASLKHFKIKPLKYWAGSRSQAARVMLHILLTSIFAPVIQNLNLVLGIQASSEQTRPQKQGIRAQT